MTLGRGRPALRLRQARPALRARDRGRDRADARLGLRRLRRGGGGALPARAAGALARRAREARGDREAVGREGARLPRLRRRRRGRARRSRSSSPRPSSSASRPSPGTTVLFAADEPAMVSRVLGALRLAARPRARADRRGRLAVPLGHRLPDVRVGRRARALGRRPPSVHAAERREHSRCSTPIPGAAQGDRLRPRRQRHRARGRLVPDPRGRAAGEGLRPAATSRPRSSARSSASCSTRSRWARRRTAASPRASTGCRWRCSTSRSSATRSPSRRTRPGSTRCRARRPPSSRPQLARARDRRDCRARPEKAVIPTGRSGILRTCGRISA